MKPEKDTVRESNYDGIQEYDNDLPKWWLALFYITIAYAVLYSVYAVGFRGASEERLAAELATIEAARSQPSPPTSSSNDSLLTAVSDASQIAAGKGIFATRCAPCHGAEGQGIVGPNLTDKYWIHGGSPAEIRRTIEVGVPAKGMIAWKGVLSDTEVVAAVAYIHSLRDSNPKNPKAPEGTPIQ